MYVAGSIIHVVLFVFIALMWVRFIVDWVMVFARQWQPTGPLLVVLEVVYSVTDPPIKALRKVIPPLRLGNFALDLSFLLVLVIAWGTWGLLKDSVAMSLLAVPKTVSQSGVRAYLAGLPGVEAVHDLHIWPMSTTETALTAHLVMPGGHPGDQFLREVAEELAHHHRIGHTTIQIERDRVCVGGC